MDIYDETRRETEALFDRLSQDVSRIVVRHAERIRSADKARIAELEAALRGIVRHWNEFGDMMGVNDDYGFSERLDAAEKLTK